MRIYAPLNREEQQQLFRLAKTERRSPQDQAAFFIRRGLEEAGLIQPQFLRNTASQREEVVTSERS